jgi:hypothetical protein
MTLKRLNVAGLVVALSPAACHQDHPVRALVKGFENQAWIYPAGAHYPNDFKVGRVCFLGSSRGIGCLIGTPVAEKSDDFWLTRIFYGRHFGRSPLIIRNLSLIANCVNINYWSAFFIRSQTVFLDTQAGFILIPKNRTTDCIHVLEEKGCISDLMADIHACCFVITCIFCVDFP